MSLAYWLDNGKITVEFRGDPLFKTVRKYINKIKKKWLNLEVSRKIMWECGIDSMWCVTQQKGTTNVKKNYTELIYIQYNVSYV